MFADVFLLTASMFKDAASLYLLSVSHALEFVQGCNLVPAVVVVAINVEDFLALDGQYANRM